MARRKQREGDDFELEERLAFLEGTGAAERDHTGGTKLLPHLLGVRELLVAWGARPAMHDAGLFHSVYGTEFFRSASVSEGMREMVRDVIGDDAEEISWLWCHVRRGSLADNLDRGGPAFALDRRDGSRIELPGERLDDLATLWTADTIEQLPRRGPDGTNHMAELHRLRVRAMPVAREALEAALAEHDWPSGP